MPRNAIATGMVDDVAPIARIPGLLMEYARRGWAVPETPGEQAGESHREDLNSILALVLTKTRSDFRCYELDVAPAPQELPFPLARAPRFVPPTRDDGEVGVEQVVGE